MRLTDWVSETREENENLDIFLQIVRLLRESKKGQGAISPAFYEVDAANNVTFIEATTFGEFEAPEDFAAPEAGSKNSGVSEKRDVFSLGLLLYFLTTQKLCQVDRSVFGGRSFWKSRKKFAEGSAFVAEDSKRLPKLIERMTRYKPEARPSLREILSILQTENTCKFGIVRENVLTKERYIEIVRYFSEMDVYKYIPEKEYVVDLVTIVPLSLEPLLIPFRLIKKQYILPVAYGGTGRWQQVERKASAPDFETQSRLTSNDIEQAQEVDRAVAALYFCDAVYGVEGHALFCETDGYSYEMGLYEHLNDGEDKKITITKEGEIAVPERIEARILSILREGSKAVYDLFCVAVYGKQNPAAIKTINDLFPEAVRIYNLSDEDLLRGALLYLESKKESLTKTTIKLGSDMI